MEDLYTYLKNDRVDEGLFKPALGFMYIKKMDPDYLLNGVLNMYEYIINKDDIKLFYKDFPLKEVPFWETVYKLYESEVFCIYDVSKKQTDEEESDEIEGCFDEEGELIKVTPEFRRQLRQIINQSSSKTDISPAMVNEIMLVDDPKFDKRYIFTINKIQGAFRRAFKALDVKMLEAMFKKMSE